MKFMRKQALVDAVQYTGHNGTFLQEWSNGAVVEKENAVWVGPHVVHPTDWILREAGTYFVVAGTTFDAEYEPASEINS